VTRYRFHTADVFTERAFGGNQLAVLPDARGLTDEQMLAVTREFNYSESVFVLPPDDASNTRRLRIFTPGGELPFAGHPTLGAAHVLAAIGEILLDADPARIVFEEGVGPVRVAVRHDDGVPVSAQLTAAQPPEYGPKPPTHHALARVLSIDANEIGGEGLTPRAVSCGVPFLMVPLRDRAALGRAEIDLDQWAQVLADFWAPHVYLVCGDPERPGSDLRARMFAPGMGIVEDPATGAAATALAGYLGAFDNRSDGTRRWVVEQGVEMGRPSILHVEADKRDGAIVEIRVGGSTVMMAEGTIEVPAA